MIYVQSKAIHIANIWILYSKVKKQRFKETIEKWDQVKAQLIKDLIDIKEKYKKGSKKCKKIEKYIKKYVDIKKLD